MGKNGYFQICLRNEKTFLRIFPAQDGGQEISIKEVTDYLEGERFTQYELRELAKALEEKEKVQEIYIGANPGYAIHERMICDITPDKMEATCRFYPPSEHGTILSPKDIVDDLVHKGIRVGIDKDEIYRFLVQREYCTDYKFVKGFAPVCGRDAQLKYYFNTNPNVQPKRMEDGSVDYHDLNTINAVSAGDLLAEVIPEDPGRPGKNVMGALIQPPKVKKRALLYANNIELSEDEHKIYSKVTGHVNLVGGKVFVADVFDVPADVDLSTGNIDYKGNVHIKGNVKSGFTVRASGDIVVNGIVEDAVLEAGGQIIVKRGIHGKTKGILQAKGNILSKFVENSTVSAGGYIESESILYSQVTAKTDVRVKGKKGLIIGGCICAAGCIEAETIGNDMGAKTILEIGVEPESKKRFEFLNTDIRKLDRELEQLEPSVKSATEKLKKGTKFSADKLKHIQEMLTGYKEKSKTLAEEKSEQAGLIEQFQQETRAQIVVNKKIYPGVQIVIKDISTTIKSERSHCKYVREKADIVAKNL